MYRTLGVMLFILGLSGCESMPKCPTGSLPLYGENIDKACGGKVGVTLKDQEGSAAGQCRSAGPKVVMCVREDWCKDGDQLIASDKISCQRTPAKDPEVERRRVQEEKRAAEEKAARERKEQEVAACRKRTIDACLSRDPAIYATPNQQCNDPRTHRMERRNEKVEMPECYSLPVYGDCVGKCILINRQTLERVCIEEANLKCT